MLQQRHRMVHRLLAGALTVVAVASMVGPAQAAPKSGRTSYAQAIEPLAAYEPQTTCSPTAKAGTADLSRRLLKAYPGSRSLGIVRACAAGGRSEHKEGRAFDWGVNAKSARDRAYVNNFTTWLFATDRHGNRFAMARRLGIQYVIWNKRIWGSYAGTGGWRPYSGASPHTDHVHISFTRAGAAGKTSFWTKVPAKVKAAPVYTPPKNTQPALRQPAPAKKLPGGPELEYEVLSLDARSAAGVTTRSALVAGETYLIEAQGAWAYNQKTGAMADAECSRSTRDGTWRRDRSVHAMDVTSDHLDLYVDGVDLLATPDVDTGNQCDKKTHMYRWEYTPTRSGRVPFQLWDPGTYKDNGGVVVISVMHAVAKAEMAFSIPAQGNTGVTSPGALEAGATYVATVGGSYAAGGGVTADAECSSEAGGAWQQNQNLDLYVDGRDVRAEPVLRDASGCNSTNHLYRFVLQPRRTRPVNMRVADPDRADNVGALEVRLVKVGAVIGPESVAVNSAVATGVTTERNYPAGQPLLVTVGGTYSPGPGLSADAECSATTADPVWRSWRSALVDAQGSGLGDVTVNGRSPEWEPVGIWTSCEPTHTYTTKITPSEAGPLSFAVADTNFSDNAGVLYVTVEPADARPTLPPVVRRPVGPANLAGGPALEDETVRVDATSPAGALTAGSFTAGETYLIEASGTWQYANSPQALADAECSRSPNDGTWRRNRSVHRSDAGSHHLDLYVDGIDLLAKEDTNSGEGCDLAAHMYRWEFTPTRSGRMSLQLWDPSTYADNSGGLDVRVIRYADRDELVWAVPANSLTGASSPGALEAGAAYVATVSGTFDAGGGVTADAECSAAAGEPWQLNRSVLATQPAEDHLDLLLDRKDITGDPVLPTPGVAGCDTQSHGYRFVLKPTVTKPINLRVYDPSPGDNAGRLTVRVVKVVPVSGAEALSLDTAGLNGATSVRNYQAGRPLLLTVAGTYTFGGGVTADAECTMTAADPVWRTSRSGLVDAKGRGMGDVTVNGTMPDWRRGEGTGCDATTHRYTLRYTPSVDGPLVLSLADTNFADNAGTLAISIEATG